MKEKIKNSLKAKFSGQYINDPNKQRSLIILIIGFSVLLVLLIMAKISYNNTATNNNNENHSSVDEVTFLSLDKIFNNYLDNYKYNVTINDNDTIITYEDSISNGTLTGKRTYKDTILEYSIINDVPIDLKTNTQISNLYDVYLSNFFNPTNVYEFIKDKENNEEIVDNKKIYIYNSIYNDGDIMFKITTTKDRIEEINYLYNNINYKIVFD